MSIVRLCTLSHDYLRIEKENSCNGCIYSQRLISIFLSLIFKSCIGHEMLT